MSSFPTVLAPIRAHVIRAQARSERRALPITAWLGLGLAMFAASPGLAGDAQQVRTASGILWAAALDDRLEVSYRAPDTGHDAQIEIALPDLVEITSVAALSVPGDEGTKLVHRAVRAGSESAAVMPSWWAAGARLLADGRTDLVLLVGDGGDARRIASPAPGREGVRVRRRPVLLVDHAADRLVAMAWLEGDSARANEVWVAEWLDGRFAAPEQVSAAGPGSQLGLSGVVLADGSWLLVWSAYDGQDDEIVVRRRTDAGWSAIESLTQNEVPDVTPAVQSTPRGALVAWSGFRGSGYQVEVQVVAIDGESLRLEPVDGAAPSTLGRGLYPSWVDVGDRAVLRWIEARPRAWRLAHIDDRAVVVSSGRAEVAHRTAPAVLGSSSSATEVELRWADGVTPRSSREDATSAGQTLDRVTVALAPPG